MAEIKMKEENKSLQVFVVMNSFKNSLSSEEANDAAVAGIHLSRITADCRQGTAADGRTDILEILKAGKEMTDYSLEVMDALGDIKTASYSADPEAGIVYMNISQAAPVNDETRRYPLEASTYGAGQMIQDAMDQGFRNFVISTRDVAACDGGKDMLEALGFRFLNQDGEDAGPGNPGLAEVIQVDDSEADPRLNDCVFKIACNTQNSLLGDECDAIFGSQKAEAGMKRWKDISLAWRESIHPELPESDFNQDQMPGAGAGGGLGFAFAAYLNGTLMSEADLVVEKNEIEKQIEWADLVITGTECFDSSSMKNQWFKRILELAKKHKKKVLVFAGSTGLSPDEILESGVDSVFSIRKNPCFFEDELNDVYSNAEITADQLEQCVFEVFMLIKSFAKA